MPHITITHHLIPDQSVDLGNVYIIELLHCLLDLWLVSPEVHYEHQRVVILDLLHGRLCGQWMLDDGIVVQPGPARDALARILGPPWALESLGSVEMDGGAHLSLHLGVRPLQNRLLSLQCLDLGL